LVGESYNVSVSVSAASGAPTGSITVSDDQGASCGPAVVSSGVASCSLASTVVGSRTLTTTYTPSGNTYFGSSITASHPVNQVGTSLSISTHSHKPSVPGTTTTVTVALAAVAPRSGVPDGVVTVSSGNGDTCTITRPAATSCVLTLSAPGPWTLGASYVGNANFAGSSANGVSHAITAYTLTYAAGANGSITGTSPQTVNHGANGTAVAAVAATGYHFVQWSDGSIVNPRTDNNVTGNIAVTASFAINQYSLNYSAGANGSITGTTAQTVNHGANGTAVTAVAAIGYHFTQWSDASTANPRTDNNVTGNIAVTASFAINEYALNYSAGANGSITGTIPQTGNHGANGTAVTAVAAIGYHFTQWSDASTANPRTDNNVTTNLSVTASFAINEYTLTYGAGANGSITGTSPQTVNHGSNGSAVTAVAATGYHFVQWSDGSIVNPRTDVAVTGNVSVTATFVLNGITTTTISNVGPSPSRYATPISVTAQVGGGIDPTGTVTVTATPTIPGTPQQCGALLAAGSATCQLTPSVAGAYTLTASYAGDSNDAASSSVGVAHTVYPSCSLDIDGDTGTLASTDGLLVMRHLIGLTDTALIEGAYNPAGSRTTSALIGPFIQTMIDNEVLDLDGDTLV